MVYPWIICFAAILSGSLSQVHSQTLGRDVLTLSKAVSRFSQNLYKEIAINRPVAVFSPFSAHTALSMTYLGARGQTAEEMKTVLQLSSLPEPHDAYSELLLKMNSVEDVKILAANGIWVHPNFKLIQQYQSDLAKKYEAIADTFDFKASGGPTAPINQWVASRTQNKITDLLKPDDIGGDTKAVIINALYFNGTWESGFEKSFTEKDIFQIDEMRSVRVDFMNQQSYLELKVSAAGDVDVLRLPFVNNRFSLYIALPKTTAGLSTFENKIVDDSYDLNELFTGLIKRNVFVTIPKFKLTSTLDLNKSLIKLGMGTAYTDEADFSGMSKEHVHIEDVIQQVVVEVEERGVVAAAATKVIFGESGLWNSPDAYIFKADHPFLYFLRDDDSGMILFQGKQSDPTQVVVDVK